jgi:hypothetical protein
VRSSSLAPLFMILEVRLDVVFVAVWVVCAPPSPRGCPGVLLGLQDDAAPRALLGRPSVAGEPREPDAQTTTSTATAVDQHGCEAADRARNMLPMSVR